MDTPAVVLVFTLDNDGDVRVAVSTLLVPPLLSLCEGMSPQTCFAVCTGGGVIPGGGTDSNMVGIWGIGVVVDVVRCPLPTYNGADFPL